VPPKPLPSAIPARGVRQLGFWGATTRLLVLVPGHLPDNGIFLHCDHLPPSTAVYDFEQRTMATSVNGASDALGMGLSTGYILFSSLYQFMVFMCYVVSVTFYMLWMFVYVILMLAGMFRLSCLYVFYHDHDSYMIYITLLLYLFCLILVHMNMLIILFYSCEYI
jgi:hypothetical protein